MRCVHAAWEPGTPSASSPGETSPDESTMKIAGWIPSSPWLASNPGARRSPGPAGRDVESPSSPRDAASERASARTPSLRGFVFTECALCCIRTAWSDAQRPSFIFLILQAECHKCDQTCNCGNEHVMAGAQIHD